jgi:hypothetical protein
MEGSYDLLTADLTLEIPSDMAFASSTELVEELSRLAFTTTVRRRNAKVAYGGNVGDGVIWGIWLALVGGVSLLPFTKRFFELLAEDAHAALARRFGKSARELRDQREESHQPTYIFIQVLGEDWSPDVERPPSFLFRWLTASDEDLMTAVRSARDLLEGASTLPGEQAWRWNPDEQRWEPYTRYYPEGPLEPPPDDPN